MSSTLVSRLKQSLDLEKAKLISVCGSGGKTTLIFALAREFLAAGERILITSTTKLGKEEVAGSWPVIAASNTEQVLENARFVLEQKGQDRAGTVIAFSKECGEGKKLKGFCPEIINSLKREAYFDRILVEADGSAQRALKAPAKHEPVIPAATDALVIVAGLNGLDLPLHEKNLFRPDIWAGLTGVAPCSTISAASLAQVIMHKDGLAKGCPENAKKILLLNQADTLQTRAKAQQVVQFIAATTGNKPQRCVSACLLPKPEIDDIYIFRTTCKIHLCSPLANNV